MAIHKRKRKSGVRYTAVIRVVGQPSESQTFDSLKQAERWHNSRLEQIANGSKVLESRARTARLNDILPRYAEQVAAVRLAARRMNVADTHRIWRSAATPSAISVPA